MYGVREEMATHSSVLAWRIPGTGNLVGCRLWGGTESDTTEAISSSSSMVLENILVSFFCSSCPVLPALIEEIIFSLLYVLACRLIDHRCVSLFLATTINIY